MKKAKTAPHSKVQTLFSWWQRLKGTALYGYFRLVGRTARLRIEGQENLALAQASGRPILWSFWHGQLMPVAFFIYRRLDPANFVVIIVGDDRNDVLSTLATRLGAAATHAVDMQGAPMAAGRAVLRVIRAMQAGRDSVIAPDGPDGPAFVAKEGVAFLVARARATLLPVGAWTRQAFQLNRWDHYLVVFPFARITITIGPPILADENADSAALLAQITDALNASRLQAKRLAMNSSPASTDRKPRSARPA